MEFTKSLIKGKLVKRYKRFFADIKVNKKIVIAHCPNTGSMEGLLDINNEVWISKNDDPKRKLKYTLELIKVKKILVGVNKYKPDTIEKVDILNIDNTKVRKEQIKKLSKVRRSRNNKKVFASLEALSNAARQKPNTTNLLEHAINAARNRASVGEISDALEDVFSRHREITSSVSGVYNSAFEGK